MKIIVTHSSGFDFRKELYEPILSSSLNTQHDFYLPQEADKEKITDDMIKNADLVFAEVSYPSTGQGIELGWANVFDTPIVCFYKSGTKPSSALNYITDTFVEYSTAEDLISKLGDFLKNKYIPEKKHFVTLVVGGAVIKKDGKYLLIQEKQPKAYGLWNFPAGKVDLGETFEQAAIREAKEESGYDVEIIKKIGVFQTMPNHAVKHAFEAKIIGGELNFPPDEILDAKWFTFDEIKQMKDKLREGWILDAINILESR